MYIMYLWIYIYICISFLAERKLIWICWVFAAGRQKGTRRVDATQGGASDWRLPCDLALAPLKSRSHHAVISVCAGAALGGLFQRVVYSRLSPHCFQYAVLSCAVSFIFPYKCEWKRWCLDMFRFQMWWIPFVSFDFVMKTCCSLDLPAHEPGHMGQAESQV